MKKYKKYISVLLIFCLICTLSVSCSQNEDYQGDEQDSSSINGSSDNNNANIKNNSSDSDVPDGNVDVDLTVLSSTMVYAEVYNITTNPDDYMGKTIKMSGSYYTGYYNETDQYYHYVIIEDAAACCQEGLEFVWNGDHLYPDDYPEEQTKIEVIGIFGSYEELGQTYYYLAVDNITILNK